MKWAASAVWLCILVIGAGALGLAQQVDVISLQDGSFIQGQVVAGFPPLVGLTLTSGERVTISRDNIQVVYFRGPQQENDIVETRDGNVMVGTLTGLAPLITVETQAGDMVTLNPENIVYIRFGEVTLEEETPPPTAQPTPQPPLPTPACLPQLMESYRATSWRLTLGLGYFVGGLLESNGFGYPVSALGATATLGLCWRRYWPPHPLEVERLLAESCLEVCQEQESTSQARAASECLGINRFFYLQLGVDFITFFGGGGGLGITIGRSALLDLGFVINPVFPWMPPVLPYLGVLVTF